MNHYTGKMLEIRPNCELCDKDLLADATDACICSYECTFCEKCVADVLGNVCPNCGGGFVSRPIRPKTAYREGTSLEFQPASIHRIFTSFTNDEISAFVQKIKQISAEDR